MKLLFFFPAVFGAFKVSCAGPSVLVCGRVLLAPPIYRRERFPDLEVILGTHPPYGSQEQPLHKWPYKTPHVKEDGARPKDDAGCGRMERRGHQPAGAGQAVASPPSTTRGASARAQLQDATCAQAPRGQLAIILGILLTDWRANQGL